MGPFSYNRARGCLRHEALVRTAKVAELVDAPALGAGGATLGGSSPPFRTIGAAGGHGTHNQWPRSAGHTLSSR